MVERCAVTELLVDQCGCPQHRGEPAPEERDDRALGPWFTASYPGRCSDCDTSFEPGDRIRADGEGGYLGTCCGGEDDG